MVKYIDNDKKEERLINKVKTNAGVGKGSAIAILKSKGTLKQKKGTKGLTVKKQTKKDKMDESLGMRRGKESGKKQSYKSRRDESKGMKKSKKK